MSYRDALVIVVLQCFYVNNWNADLIKYVLTVKELCMSC